MNNYPDGYRETFEHPENGCVLDGLILLDDEWKRWNTRTAPKVKPLAWEVFDAETAWAHSPFGTYRYDAPKLTLSTQKNYVGDGLGNWRMGDFEAAKAAAQADYERRILSALE